MHISYKHSKESFVNSFTDTRLMKESDVTCSDQLPRVKIRKFRFSLSSAGFVFVITNESCDVEIAKIACGSPGLRKVSIKTMT